MKRLCTCLISMTLLNQSFETNQKSKYKIDLNFIFISTEKKYYGNILNFFWENPGTNQNFIADLFTARSLWNSRWSEKEW